MIPWLYGDVEVISRGVHAQCVPGSVTVGEPGEPYVLRPHSEMRGEFRVIRIDQTQLEEIVSEAAPRPSQSPFPRAPVVTSWHAALFNGAYQAIEHADSLRADEPLIEFVSAMSSLDMDAGPARAADNRLPKASISVKTSAGVGLTIGATVSPAQAVVAPMITPALLILASGSLVATALVRL